jgi:Flp pilus assembly protein TadD
VVILTAPAALSLVAATLSGATNLRDSQAAAATRPAVALRDAADARRVQPYAASPRLQEALLLEQRGDLAGAAAAAARATRSEPTNWRTWFVRARIEAEQGKADAAVRHYRRVRDLNPRSNLFVTQ